MEKTLVEMENIINELHRINGTNDAHYVQQLIEALNFLSEGEIKVQVDIKDNAMYFTIKYPNEDAEKFFEG